MKKPNEKPQAATEGADIETAGSQAKGSKDQSASNDCAGWSEAPPYELTFPPGLVGELAQYFYDSARYPMREAAILASLGLLAGVAGRAFNYAGTGLTLYLLLLAKSGRGKEDMADGIGNIIAAVRASVPMISDFIGPRKFASGQGLTRKLESQPSFLSIQGEFGLRLKELNDPRASASTGEIRLSLLDLYGKSGRNKIFSSTAYSDREKDTKIIHSPSLSLLGESTPGHVFDNLSFKDIEDGLLPRCLILECDDKRPYENEQAGFAPNADLVRRFADIADICLRTNANVNVPIEPKPILPKVEAAEMLRALSRELNDEFNDHSGDPYDRALWNRAGLNIKRIAGLVAVGDTTDWSAGYVTLDDGHMGWAIDFVEYCVTGLLRRFQTGLVGTGEGRQEGEIKKYVREYVRMPSGRRHHSYRVAKAIAAEIAIIPLGYIRRRAMQCNAFTQDRRGFNAALTSAMDALCRTGILMKMDAESAQRRFSVRGELYLVINTDLS